MWPESLCDGHVVHHRLAPREHRFKYAMCWLLLPLERLDAVCKANRGLSHNRFNWLSIRDRDYVNDSAQPIAEKLQNWLQQRTGQTFNGQVLLFTHPKFLGLGFNSVNFYLCHEQQRLRYIVSEINNTPWGEKHLYLHRCDDDAAHIEDRFDKRFHISPFIGMDIRYEWHFRLRGDRFDVHMRLHHGSGELLRVRMRTRTRPLAETSLTRFITRRPMQGVKMWLAIYWQALKLWLKGTPVHDHPDTSRRAHPRTGHSNHGDSHE